MKAALKLSALCIVISTAMAQDWNIREIDTARGVDYLTESEKDVILLVNKVRTMPALFARAYLESHRSESTAAEECYNELLKWTAQKPLKPSKALSLAARDHGDDMGKTGEIGHVSSNGKSSTQRVLRYGVFKGAYTGPWENCSYGFEDPLEIILQLLIDDDVPSRGHRKNIMEVEVNFIGTSIRPHKTYEYNCVMDFADAIADK